MPTTRQYTVITHKAALTIIERAIAEGEKLGVPISVTVFDPWMNLVAFAKADGATPHSVDSSRRKANTAASTRRPTGWMKDDLALPLPLATDMKLTNIIGGYPLTFESEIAGGLGVAGGTPDQDAQIAATAAAYALEL